MRVTQFYQRITRAANRAKAHSRHENALRDFIRRNCSRGYDGEEGGGQHQARYCVKIYTWSNKQGGYVQESVRFSKALLNSIVLQ